MPPTSAHTFSETWAPKERRFDDSDAEVQRGVPGAARLLSRSTERPREAVNRGPDPLEEGVIDGDPVDSGQRQEDRSDLSRSDVKGSLMASCWR
jgi:hypothetical protein